MRTRRHINAPTITLIPIIFFAVACGETDANNGDELPSTEDVSNKASETYDDGKSKLEDEIDCSGIVREETRVLVTDVIEEAEADIHSLPTTPGELARLAGAIAVTRDSTMMLAGNVGALMQRGHFPDAISGKWDELQCDDVKSFSCVDGLTGEEGGKGETRVECSGETRVVRASFEEGCRLFGTENDGALNLAESGALSFDALKIGSVAQADGQVAVELMTGETFAFTADTSGEPFSIASNAGKSCESRLTFEDISVVDDAQSLSAEFDVARTKDAKTTRVRTLAGPAVWSHADECSCPMPGAELEIDVSDFLGTGKPGTFRVAYDEANDTCAAVTVDVVSWPEACDEVDGDCGRQQIEELLSRVASAACVG